MVKDKETEKAIKKIRKEITERYKPKKKHKHWFQFVQKWRKTELEGSDDFNSSNGDSTYAEFICLCGKQRIVEIKKAEKSKEK